MKNEETEKHLFQGNKLSVKYINLLISYQTLVETLLESEYRMVVVTAVPGGAHKVLLISSSSQCSDMAAPPLRKRQRLTHLSPEEKALRR